jgi:hypothetical protein
MRLSWISIAVSWQTHTKHVLLWKAEKENKLLGVNGELERNPGKAGVNPLHCTTLATIRYTSHQVCHQTRLLVAGMDSTEMDLIGNE